MPKTAAVMKSFSAGVLPEEMSDDQIQLVVDALIDDLPGDPIGYIQLVAPLSERCECGAVHLRVDDAKMPAVTAASLHRLLATPYGDIVREQFRRTQGYKDIRFGWSGISDRVPRFMAEVQRHGVCTSNASDIPDDALADIIAAYAVDMPDVMTMVRGSAMDHSVYSVSPSPGDVGNVEWKQLIDQVMFTWSTPVRKYLVEWLDRQFDVRVGAVNCCIVMTSPLSGAEWHRRWSIEQTNQQLTPDC